MKILVLSGDFPLAQNIFTCLGRAGFQVIYRSTGIGANEKILEERPDLVILDQGLPGLNCLAIVRYIRSKDTINRLPVILVGSNLKEEDILIGLEVGADLCLREVFHPQVFVARVRSLLRRSEAVKSL